MSKCHHRYFCSKEHQLLDWKFGGHKYWCCKSGEINYDYEIKECKNKGKGIYTLRGFKKNEKIMVERPVLKVIEYKNKDDLKIVFNKNEPESVKQAVNLLSSNEDNLPSKFHNNCVCIRDGGGLSGLFINFSRINHSCISNSSHTYLSDQGVMILVACCDLPKGTEITFSYLYLRILQKERIIRLRDCWGFECNCLACRDSIIAGKLDRITILDSYIPKLGKDKNVEGVLATGKELIKLHSELNYSAQLTARVYFDMFQLAISKNIYYHDAIGYLKDAQKKHEEYFSCDCELSREFLTLIKNPEWHENFGRGDVITED